ncbi:MAG: aminoglycoside phosphotransferase family protein [Kineosporiaceae bacterium]
MSAVELPPDWLDWISRLPADGGPDGATWAAGLRRLLDQMLATWQLEPTGEPVRTGWTAVAVPVRREGDPAMLKLVWPHRESLGEHLALRRWAGAGAVRLIAADPGHGALLLERLDADRDLRALPIDDACAVIGGLLRRLHVPALPQLLRLTEYVSTGLAGLTEHPDALPRRYVEQSRGLVRELSADPASTATLIHTDLHFENVLAGGREPWLAIDPKPMAGHPGYEVHPVLLNRSQDHAEAGSLRRGVRRRFEIVCDTADLDRDQARAWTIVHATLGAFWAAREGDAPTVGLSIAILKALDD